MVSCLSELPLATGNFCGPVKPNYQYYFDNFTLQTGLQTFEVSHEQYNVVTFNF